MASVRQRGKKGKWYALYRDAQGKLWERPTKAKTRSEAQKLADAMEGAARQSEGEQIVQNLQRVVSETHRRILGSDMPKMTPRLYVSQLLTEKKHEVSPDTLGFYEQSLARFITQLGARADLDIFRINQADILAYRNERIKTVSGSTTNHELKSVRMLFRKAFEEKWIPENPCKGVKLVKVTRREKTKVRPYAPEELAALMAAGDDEDKAMIIRAYYTGQRLLDICEMTGVNEDPHLGVVKFWTNKTDLRVILEMAPPYIEWVLSRSASDDPKAPLHPRAHASVSKRTKNRTVTISNRFAWLQEKAGLRPRTKHRKAEGAHGRGGRHARNELNFHSLRHTMTTDLANAGVQKTVVMDIVGHESEEINTGYTHHDRETKKAAVAKLRDITRLITQARSDSGSCTTNCARSSGGG